MRSERREREIQRVVKRVLRLIPNRRAVGKADFESILAEIMECVQEKTGASEEQLHQLKTKVIDDLPKEYGQLAEGERSWPALIVYLYSKFEHELASTG